MHVDVVLTAERLTPEAVEGASVLVIDVLRASTTIVSALTHGCRALIPVADPDEARRRARAAPGGALLAGERRGETLPGFDLGNSPIEVAGPHIRGRTVLLTTSNGTRALLAARKASAIGVAGFVNLAAAAAWAAAPGCPITLACAGERGCGVARGPGLCRPPRRPAGGERSVPRPHRGRPRGGARGRPRTPRSLTRLREDSRWARHLIRTGRGRDVDACLSLDTSTLVPVYRPDVDEIVAGRG